MNPHPALRLTPSNSPFFKTATPKSPVKSRHEEAGLRLTKAIGTTTSNANGFDCLPGARQFAYTAGAAAVVCTVQDDLKVTQRFFRARPSTGGGYGEVNGHGPITPTPGNARSRMLAGVREHGANGSPLGASSRDWSDSPGGKSTTAKDRVKAATSVALSPNGKWVAVGETGYKPRILIFSNRGDSSEAPICALSEHTFGVNALRYSPDSKYLASLGTVNDGFVYIWSIDNYTGAALLHSSNKCTVLVNAMIWVGRSLLTVGLRFVKCWRLDDEGSNERRPLEPATNVSTPRSKATDFGNSILSPKHKFLPGKNSLLGDLIDANFVTALPIGEDRAVVCTESGEVCVLDDCHNAQALTATALAGFRITASSLGSDGRLVVYGPDGKSKSLDISKLRSPLSNKSTRRQTISPMKSCAPDLNATIATAAFDDVAVELDSKRGIHLTRTDDEETQHQLAAHNEAVLGVQSFASTTLPEAAFLTFSSNGTIQIWSYEGDHVTSISVPVESSPAMYDVTNELRAVAALSDGQAIAAGDKYGTLSIINTATGTVITQVRAHSAEIADIQAFDRNGVQLLATASRDRTVQLFSFADSRLELLQTMDEHAAAVSSLLIAKVGDLLLSCSTDRTIVVREVMSRATDPTSVAFAMLRTITLKSSPTAMCLKGSGLELLVSSVDRSVGIYDIETGQAGFNFKCSDNDGGESAALSKILCAPSLNGNPTIIGVSNSDKSVRLYSEYGMLVARDWGHTEGVTDVALVTAQREEGQSARQRLVTVAADSTVFMWDTMANATKQVSSQPEPNEISETTPVNKLSTPIGPPLRKVISFSELSRFKRERSIDGSISESPTDVSTPTQPPPPPSPHRLRKKTSRASIAQPPKLDPAFKSSFAATSRRRSIRQRSPSPPSPRNTAKKETTRKPTFGMSLRSKSSDNVLTTATAGNANGFGTINASTESVCRTLRAYRKKLATSSSSDSIAPETLRELEKELKLTARVVGEKSAGKNLDGAMMSRLMEQASEKIVHRLDERIKERVESEVRRSAEGSPSTSSIVQTPAIEEEDQMEAVAGALEQVSLRGE